MNPHHQAVKEVEDVLQNINRSWTQGRPQELAHYFHSDMVIQGPGLQSTIKGQNNCVKHHEDFTTHTSIKNFTDSEFVVNIWDNTAVASYKFDIEFEADGKVRKESGHELYSFVRENNKWKAVWNTIMPSNTGA